MVGGSRMNGGGRKCASGSRTRGVTPPRWPSWVRVVEKIGRVVEMGEQGFGWVLSRWGWACVAFVGCHGPVLAVVGIA